MTRAKDSAEGSREEGGSEIRNRKIRDLERGFRVWRREIGERRDAARASVREERGRVGGITGGSASSDALFERVPFLKYTLRFLDGFFSREPTPHPS